MARLIRFMIWFCVGLAPLASAQNGDKTKTKIIVPFGKPRIVQFDAGKGRTFVYHALVKGQSLGFAIDGPAMVEIRSRAGLSGENIQADYQVQVWNGEYLVHADKHKAKKAEGRFIGSALLPAAARAFQFDVPLGLHNYRLWLVSENIDTVFVRIAAEKISAEGAPPVTLWPLEYNRKVHLYSKKNQTMYYLIDQQKGLKLKAAGPLDLIMTTRANFTSELDGRIGYTIAVSENGKELKVFSATVEKSLSTAYQDLTGVVPSQPEEFILRVPAGTHILDFSLKESAAQTVSIRFSLPKQDSQ